MIYLTWAQVRATLFDEYRKTKNARLLAITNDQMRQWVRRDKIKRSAAGYEALSLLAYLNKRFGVPLAVQADQAVSSRLIADVARPEVVAAA